MSRSMTARIHAGTREFARKLQRAERRLDDWLGRTRRVAVEFSGGKDSSVVLHMVRARVADAVALHGDDEWLLPETAEILAATPNLVRLRRRLTHTEWFVAWENVEGPDGGAKHRWATDHGIDGVASGLRADENNRRRTHIRARGSVFQLANGLSRCYPIADWSWRDVWAYLLSRDVPYNRAYDVLDRIGVPPERQRVGPLATERALGYGQMVYLKRGWPKLYRRFVDRYPEAASYA